MRTTMAALALLVLVGACGGGTTKAGPATSSTSPGPTITVSQDTTAKLVAALRRLKPYRTVAWSEVPDDLHNLDLDLKATDTVKVVRAPKGDVYLLPTNVVIGHCDVVSSLPDAKDLYTTCNP